MRKNASRPDEDNPEWTAEDFRRARPLKEVAPEVVAIMEAVRRQRGPQKAPTKELVSLRVDRDVIAAFRASGAGWQVRANEALRAYAKRRALGTAKPAVTKRRSIV
jgi:uncharacterized protein (DUF4415 family)